MTQKLIKALRPFAEAASSYDGVGDVSFGDDWHVAPPDDLTVGHLRSARAALEEAERESASPCFGCDGYECYSEDKGWDCKYPRAGVDSRGTLVARLRQYDGKQFQTTACYNGLRDEAADEISRLRARAEAAERKCSAEMKITPAMVEAGKDAFCEHWIGIKEGYDEDLEVAVITAFRRMLHVAENDAAAQARKEGR